MKRIKLFNLVIVQLFLGCTAAQQVNWDFGEKLLFVEGNELLAGSFGDIVLLNGEKNQRIKITHDRIYDESPFLINDSTVVFLSKRENPGVYGGLTKQSFIYAVVFDKDIEKEINKSKPKKIETDDSPSSLLWASKDYFITSNFNLDIENRYEIIKQDYLKRDLDTLSNKIGISSPGLFYIYSNEDETNFDRFILSHSYLYGVSIHMKDEKKLLEPLIGKEDEFLGILRRADCIVGSFKTKNEFFVNCRIYKEKKSKIFLYDIENDSLTSILQSDTLRIQTPVYKDDNLYFISNLYYDKDDENIWKYDLKENTLTKITNSKTQKSDLQVY